MRRRGLRTGTETRPTHSLEQKLGVSRLLCVPPIPYNHDANMVISRMRNRDQSFRTHLGGELGCLREKVIPRDERFTPKYLELNLLLVLDVSFAWHIWIYVNTRRTTDMSDRRRD